MDLVQDRLGGVVAEGDVLELQERRGDLFGFGESAVGEGELSGVERREGE